MATAKIIMAWSKCKFEFGPTGENDAFATELTDAGIVKDKTTTLSTTEGDTIQAVATGGEVIAEEQKDGSVLLQTTIIEPAATVLTKLGVASTTTGSEAEAAETLVKTLVAKGEWSVKITPKNKGARGVKAPVCKISVAPAFGEETGNEIVISARVQKTTALSDNYMYSYFTTTTDL